MPNILSIGQYYDYDKTEEKIKKFLSLKKGWYYGTGVAPSQEIINKAIELNNCARLSMLKTDAFPGEHGQIQIDCYYNDDTLEFTIHENGLVSFSHERGERQLDYEEALPFNKAIIKLNRYGQKIWNLFESSTHEITVLPNIDLQVSCSATPAMVVEFPS